MSRNFSFKPQLASMARRSYHRGMRLLRKVLSDQQAQQVVLLCDRIKHRWFRELYTAPMLVMPKALSCSTVVPEWIIAEMKSLAEIEPAIYPTSEVLAKFHTWEPPEDLYAARVYQGMLDDLVVYAPDVVFLLPHMMRGGSDLGTLHHVRECVARGCRVTVVLTRDVVSPWVDRFPAAVRIVEFGQVTRLLSESDRQLVLLRLLLQSSAQTIHLINSYLGWQVFEKFGKPLRSSGKHLFASVYCDDLDRYGIRCGYAVEFLPKVWMHLNGVFSDNMTFIQSLKQRDGLPSELMHCLYFPAPSRNISKPSQGEKVLWASRLTAQKRPELLLEIARRMPDVVFDVYGELDERGDDVVLRSLKGLPNVNYHGRYDDFSLVASNGGYALFLYTSAYDGLPNVLLEATAAGLPVVAPRIGGVGELIDSDTGFLLEPQAKELAFVESIREVLSNSEEAARRVLLAQARLRSQHSQEAFAQRLCELPDYWPEARLEQLCPVQ